MRYEGACHFHAPSGIGDWALKDDREILHILKNGDTLTIYHKLEPHQVVWQGDVVLRYHSDPPKKKVYDMLVRSDQDGIDCDVWALYFLEEWPAELVTGSD